MNTLKTMRNALLVGLAGVVIGGFGVHRLEAMPAIEMAVEGWCAQSGIQKVTVYAVLWFNCQDSAIAHNLQSADSDTSTILDQMRVNQPKKVGGKARP